MPTGHSTAAPPTTDPITTNAVFQGSMLLDYAANCLRLVVPAVLLPRSRTSLQQCVRCLREVVLAKAFACLVEDEVIYVQANPGKHRTLPGWNTTLAKGEGVHLR
jgi:hypothetical protein